MGCISLKNVIILQVFLQTKRQLPRLYAEAKRGSTLECNAIDNR